MYLLIVDDDKVICQGIIGKLKRIHYDQYYQFLTAHSVPEAEDLYDQYQPEIVITDIQMPGFSGLTLIERLRKKENLPKIFVLSGYDDYEYVRKAFLLGATDYMLKPVDIKELEGKLGGDTLSLGKPIDKLKGTDKHIIALAIEYIDLNLHRNITMGEVAKNVSLSYSYFSKLFKEHTNSTFPAYIHKRRIEISKLYLMDPSIKIVDLAKKIGYEDPSIFSRIFKKYEGCYPTEYREKQQNIL